MTKYTMPDGAEVTLNNGIRPALEGHLWVFHPTLGLISIAKDQLTEVVPPPPPEPPHGTVVLDPAGDAWYRKPDGFWWFGSRPVTWEQLVAEQETLTLLAAGAPTLAPAATGDGMRFDLARRELPARLPDFTGRRELIVTAGREAGQAKIQVVEGESYGRAAVLDRSDAQVLAWTILNITLGGPVTIVDPDGTHR